jgi:hypothetical protein
VASCCKWLGGSDDDDSRRGGGGGGANGGREGNFLLVLRNRVAAESSPMVIRTMGFLSFLRAISSGDDDSSDPKLEDGGGEGDGSV